MENSSPNLPPEQIPQPQNNPDNHPWLVAVPLSALLGLGVPTLGNLIGPLVIWLLKRQESPRLDQVGKDTLNFQISMTIYGIISTILCAVLIGIPMLLIVFCVWLYGTIRGSMRVSEGHAPDYPFSIKFMS
ncbi:MAG: DUF4870 domain-containing protein [Chthoniobacterales bacterium]